MSNHRAAFETMLKDNPCDTTTRLVYADWLEENGFDDEAVEQRRRATPEWLAAYTWMEVFATKGDSHCENYGESWEEYRKETEHLDWNIPENRVAIEAAANKAHAAEKWRAITVEDCVQAGYSFIQSGEHFVQLGSENLRDNFTDEFWHYWCILTGEKYRQPEEWEWGRNPFSCSC